ncbi:unnamed protein product [Heterobilharzia americana]|nr:unnamed protein product [Heterobilharzia americana]
MDKINAHFWHTNQQADVRLQTLSKLKQYIDKSKSIHESTKEFAYEIEQNDFQSVITDIPISNKIICKNEEFESNKIFKSSLSKLCSTVQSFQKLEISKLTQLYAQGENQEKTNSDVIKNSNICLAINEFNHSASNLEYFNMPLERNYNND